MDIWHTFFSNFLIEDCPKASAIFYNLVTEVSTALAENACAERNIMA
jgi:hypothetical protein